MKLEYFSINEFTLYLNNIYIEKINFEFDNNAEKNFKTLLEKLKSIYNLELYGYYRINVYINDNYGIIMELYKEDDEYIKIFGDSLDLKILFKSDSKILYELENYELFNIGKYNIYYYNNKFYIDVLKIDNNNEYMRLLEYSKIIYGKNVDKIYNNMIKI